MNTTQRIEKLLALQTRLVRGGLAPDHAEQVVKVMSRSDSAAVEEIAQGIVDASEDWDQQPQANADAPTSDNYFDRLRRRIELEREAQRSRGSSAKERLGVLSSEGR